MARSLGKERVGRWRKEGKERKGKERKRKVKNKSWERLAAHCKGNQPSKFILFTNKQKEYSYGTTNITSVELIKSKTKWKTKTHKKKNMAKRLNHR